MTTKKLAETKIIFFGSSEFAVPILKSLIKNTKVVAVVTQSPKPVGRKRILTKTPIHRFVSESVDDLSVLTFPTLKSPEVSEELLKIRADFFVVAAYGKIIPQGVLDIPPLGAVNVHGSLLPKYRGASPIHAALINGDAKTGNTIILMDALMDHGPILKQSSVQISPEDNFSTLRDKLAADGARLLIPALEEYLKGEILPKEQDHDSATYTELISKEDGRVDWTKSAQEIYNKWRALQEWPGIFSEIKNDGESIRIIFDEIKSSDYNLAKGQIKFIDGEVLVGCAESSIEVLKLTLASKKTMSADVFMNGYGYLNGLSFEQK